MCLSAEASFAIGGALIPASIYCLSKAKPSTVALALIPLFFGIQQFLEGVVWLGFNNNNQQLINIASLGYLYFALAFWPIWMPFSAYCITRRRIGFIFFGLIFGLFLYLPLFYDNNLNVKVVHHSIQYTLPHLPLLPEDSWRLLYLLTVTIPLALCYKDTCWYIGISAMVITALISHFMLSYAFVFLWCFFAAIIALFLCFMFRKGFDNPNIRSIVRWREN